MQLSEFIPAVEAVFAEPKNSIYLDEEGQMIGTNS
jgi:hypothetical protein